MVQNFQFHFYPDRKQPMIYRSLGRISNFQYIRFLFFVFLCEFSEVSTLFVVFFVCPPPPPFVILIVLIDNSFYLSILEHVSRSFPANLPKVPFLAPQLNSKENTEAGMSVLDILGLFSLVAGSFAIFILACCCYCRCYKSPATNV